MIAKRTTKNGDVRYDVRLRAPDGQERSKTFRTKKEAERYERAHFAALDAGTWVDPRAGRITLEEWATEWRRTIVHLRPKTVSAYDSNLRNHILPELGHHELARLRPPVLRAWLAELCTKPARGGGLPRTSLGAAGVPDAEQGPGGRRRRRTAREEPNVSHRAAPGRDEADALPDPCGGCATRQLDRPAVRTPGGARRIRGAPRRRAVRTPMGERRPRPSLRPCGRAGAARQRPPPRHGAEDGRRPPPGPDPGLRHRRTRRTSHSRGP